MSPSTPRILGVIPARAGSKTIPLKNITMLAGKPLIAYAIEAALNSTILDRTIVSTDSKQIAEVSASFGAEVPFLRPRELAKDDTPRAATVLHAVQWLEQMEHYFPQIVVTLQPTSPLRTPEDIEAAVALAMTRSADAVVSVSPVHDHPYWTKQIDPDGRLIGYLPETAPFYRRQDLPPVYVLNGAIFLSRRETLSEGSTDPLSTYAYVMPPERSLDIDTPWDLQLAELILRHQQHVESNQDRKA